MEKKYFILRNTAWFCISLYYSRKEWGRLLREIRSYYEMKKPLFTHCTLFLSEEHGEHVQVALSLSADSDLEALQQETDDYFRAFMSSYPSFEPKPFRYGAHLWGNYANNSVEWNRFEYKWVRYGQFFDFSQTTSFLLIDLLEDDCSPDNTLLMALFLCTKALRIFSETNEDKPDELIYHALKVMATEALYNSFVTGFDLKKTLALYEIDFTSIMEVIAQFWQYGEDAVIETDPVYRHWVDELRKTASANIDSYLQINRLLWDHFYVSDTLKLLIMYLLKAYQIKLSNNG